MRITGLLGAPFEHTDLDEKDQMALAIRLFAFALDAKAVLHVTEGWIATKCANCGGSNNAVEDEKCTLCGAEITITPSKRPVIGRRDFMLSHCLYEAQHYF